MGKKNFNKEEMLEIAELNKELERCCRALSCEDIEFLIEYANELREAEKREAEKKQSIS